jgi:hypothetical protein
MNIYTAGNVGIISREKALSKVILRRLLSFYEIHGKLFAADQSFEFITKKMERNKKVELFLDSGAFSAWSQGVSIDINDYIQFIKENMAVIGIYANLDVIGDVRATWNNQKIMEAAGLKPLPVFHYGEDEKWLERLLRQGYDYISLGGMVPISTDNLILWLDRIYSKYLTDSKGMPCVKVHGFGLTSLRLMLRYPWFSVDSTSWVVTGRMGGIYIPRFHHGQWMYDENSWKVTVSGRSPNKISKGKHILTMNILEKKVFMDYIEMKGYAIGKSEFKKVDQSHKLEKNEKWIDKKPSNKTVKREMEIILEPGISNTYQLRDEMNIVFFNDLEKSMQSWPWSFKTKSQNSIFN